MGVLNPVPTLVVVSGPPGAGKTTLARQVARAVGCPAVCRDDIKEGMVHAVPGFTPAPGDKLTMRTLPVFFEVLGLLLRAGVTTVAEAAFQDHVWRPHLQPLLPLARLRVLHCTVDPEVACARLMARLAVDVTRRAHADPGPADRDGTLRQLRAFSRLSLGPWLEVDTSDGYRPGLDGIVTFIADNHELSPCADRENSSLSAEPAKCSEMVGCDAYVVLSEQALLAGTPRADGRREGSRIGT